MYKFFYGNLLVMDSGKVPLQSISCMQDGHQNTMILVGAKHGLFSLILVGYLGLKKVGKFGALPLEQHGEQDSAGTIIFLRMLNFLEIIRMEHHKLKKKLYALSISGQKIPKTNHFFSAKINLINYKI
jgi:hypothetical protein